MKGHTRHQVGSPIGWPKYLAISLVVSALVTACVGSGASPDPSVSANPTATASASTSVTPEASPTASPSPFTSASESPSAEATETAAASPQPSTGSLALGRWTGITWKAVGQIPELAQATGDSTDTYSASDVYGWSGGYVGFRTVATQGQRSDSFALTSTSSSDATHWSAGRAMDVAGLAYAIEITSVVEGPASLVAVGRITGMACGGPPTVAAMWTSADGLAWSRVTPPADFTSATVYTVEGGTAGFIATGIMKDSVTQGLWISPDGRSWHSVALPKSVFGEVVVQGATGFGGGYVLSGAIRGDDGCGGPRYVTPSLWWSPGGTAWTRATLPGAAPVADSWMTVTKVSDQALMAIANEWDAATQVSSIKVWLTADGRTWKQIQHPSSMLQSTIRSDGRHGLAVIEPTLEGVQTDGPVSVIAVDDDLSVRILKQDGVVPMESQGVNSWGTTLGPAGLVMMSTDSTMLWLGVPTAR
jgi:hypothetical protein